jgi:hypothetical protein
MLVGEEVVARVLRYRRQRGPHDKRQQETAYANLLGSSQMAPWQEQEFGHWSVPNSLYAVCGMIAQPAARWHGHPSIVLASLRASSDAITECGGT